MKYIYLYKIKNFIFIDLIKEKIEMEKQNLIFQKRYYTLMNTVKIMTIMKNQNIMNFFELNEKKQNNLIINFKDKYIQKYYIPYIIVKNKEIGNASIIFLIVQKKNLYCQNQKFQK